MKSVLLLVVLWAMSSPAAVVGFTSTRRTFRPAPTTKPVATSTTPRVSPWTASTTTVEPPSKTKKKNDSTKRRRYEDESNDYNKEDDMQHRGGPLEYLEDDPFVSREAEDPFHILLLGSTFDKPKVTVPYVSNSLNYVLDMPSDEAMELSTFAKNEGMSCLGVWPREECLSLGKKLQVRDIVCRVVPYCQGGQRGWQAKDASFDGWTGSPTEI